MICLVALVVLGILGIFSASHRALAREAFDCVFRRLTLRKCTTGFDKKMRMKISGKFINTNPKLSRFLYKYFEIISWAFTILMFASLIYSAAALYNLYVYGTCDLDNPQNCVFTEGQMVENKPVVLDCSCTFPIDECTQSQIYSCSGSEDLCDCLEPHCTG